MTSLGCVGANLVPVTFDDLSRPPLDPAALSAALTREASTWRSIEVRGSLPSTNRTLAELAREGAEPGSILVADHQSAGRGRLDRVWTTPPRSALTFSVLLAPDRVPTHRWPWLPLLVGIAVSEGLRRVTGVECSLKWPNDVLVGERKVAGVLVERVDTAAGPVAVVGVGINVSLAEDELPVPTATSLALEGATTTDRTVILREVLRSLEALYLQWQADEGDASRGLLDSFVRRCSTLGREVRVALPTGEELSGEATGIDADGRLEVRGPQGRRILGAGDVVHVRAVD